MHVSSMPNYEQIPEKKYFFETPFRLVLPERYGINYTTDFNVVHAATIHLIARNGMKRSLVRLMAPLRPGRSRVRGGGGGHAAKNLNGVVCVGNLCGRD